MTGAPLLVLYSVVASGLVGAPDWVALLVACAVLFVVRVAS